VVRWANGRGRFENITFSFKGTRSTINADFIALPIQIFWLKINMHFWSVPYVAQGRHISSLVYRFRAISADHTASHNSVPALLVSNFRSQSEANNGLPLLWEHKQCRQVITHFHSSTDAQFPPYYRHPIHVYIRLFVPQQNLNHHSNLHQNCRVYHLMAVTVLLRSVCKCNVTEVIDLIRTLY